MRKNVSWADSYGCNLTTIRYIPIPEKKEIIELNKNNLENDDFISISPPIKIISPSNNYDWTDITIKTY